MPRLRTPEATREGAALPVVRDAPARALRKAPSTPVAAPAPARIHSLRTVRPAAAAWEILAEPLRRKEGIRVGALGITGTGKTTGILAFLAYLQAEKLIDLVLIHDVKLPVPQYGGQIIHDAEDVRRAPPENYPAVRVLRRLNLDHMPSVQEAAAFTRAASYEGIPTILVVDEFGRAVSPHGRTFTAPAIAELLSEGRALGASLIWSIQIPQRAPTEAYDQSQIKLYRCGTKSLAYLVDQHVVDQAAADLIAGLQRGQFVLCSTETDFDGVIYEVPAP